MAKPAKSDRQAKLDKIRKQQKGAEKRRGYAIVGVCAAIGLAMVGAAAYNPIRTSLAADGLSDEPLAEIGAAADVCGEITTEPTNDNNNHVDENTQIQYETAPPAFGPHWNVFGLAPVPLDRQFYTENDRPELEQLIHNLEHGFTILWYDQTVADDAGQIAEVRAIARKFSGNDANRRNAFIAAPWTSEDAGGAEFPDGQHVALTHWSGGGVGQESDTSKHVGVWQYCSAPSGEALESFMEQYPVTDSPEPNAAMG